MEQHFEKVGDLGTGFETLLPEEQGIVSHIFAAKEKPALDIQSFVDTCVNIAVRVGSRTFSLPTTKNKTLLQSYFIDVLASDIARTGVIIKDSDDDSGLRLQHYIEINYKSFIGLLKEWGFSAEEICDHFLSLTDADTIMGVHNGLKTNDLHINAAFQNRVNQAAALLSREGEPGHVSIADKFLKQK